MRTCVHSLCLDAVLRNIERLAAVLALPMPGLIARVERN
jgi:hypothetical protein